MADERLDLYEILTKPVTEMSDEEIIEAMGVIREQRKVKISGSKQKTGLDLLLGKLSIANARTILEQLEAKDKPQQEAEAAKDPVEAK